MTSGKKYWSDATPVAGQQFEYTFDDIGNRKSTAAGGDQYGGNLRNASYTANSLNQYSSRTVPGYLDVQGSAATNATVTVNAQSTYRKGEYFRKELSVDNASAPVWQAITNIAVLQNPPNPDYVTTNMGNLLLAKASESFLHDADGNLVSDSLWTNRWDGGNRRTNIESQASAPANGKIREGWSYLPDGPWIQRIVSTNNGGSWVTVSTNRYVWDGQVLLAVLDHTNGVVTSFLRGLDLSGSQQGAGGVGGVLLITQRSTSQPSSAFYAFDGNGNVSALLNATNGTEAARYEYDPFGQVIRADGPLARFNPLRFSTQYADDNTGDLKYLFRDYRADTGRWTCRDFIEESGGANLYGFVGNNPLIYVDPIGWIWFDQSENAVLIFIGRIYDPRNAGNNARLALGYGKGLAVGAKAAVEGTVHLAAHPYDSAKALWALTNLTRDQLACLLGAKYDEFMRASPERQAEMIGEVFGNIEGGLAIGGGTGEGLQMLKELLRKSALAREAARDASRGLRILEDLS